MGGATSCFILMLILFHIVHGNINEILRFVKEFDFQHLDFLQFDSITFDVKEFSDNHIFTLMEHFQNQTKPFTTIKKLNECNGFKSIISSF